ncbi:MAG: DUF2071 domain-containing protein [Bacteroidota bacterium]|nr:DUF2071 domain-containing protein [Bacteroidota bacterium]
MNKTFLTAEWRKLLIVNYKVDQNLLQEYLPYKTEFDLRNNICYVSLVGFMFLNTKIKGIHIPFHTNFEEINLRFYVKHKDDNTNEWKRGVVFIKEIVPKPAVAIIANKIYKEKYECLKMKHTWKTINNRFQISYAFKKNKKNKWNEFSAVSENITDEIAPGGDAEFIMEHYWGYTKVSKSKTSEYKVEHPRWNSYKIIDYNIQVDFGRCYGAKFSFLNSAMPVSVLLAEGSEIIVKMGKNIL